uniref:Uncharacterized protein n=1 Tax=Sphingobacterium sp. (strain 21) TaxID=743722 RepID=F4CA95_SPHS2
MCNIEKYTIITEVRCLNTINTIPTLIQEGGLLHRKKIIDEVNEIKSASDSAHFKPYTLQLPFI